MLGIGIGGNSKLARDRVANKADGWMPLLLPPEYHATVRSPAIGGLPGVAKAAAEIRAVAAARGAPIDLVYPYSDSSLHDDPGADVGRHKEAFAELAEVGVTWTMISVRAGKPAQTLGFLEKFGREYISA